MDDRKDRPFIGSNISEIRKTLIEWKNNNFDNKISAYKFNAMVKNHPDYIGGSAFRNWVTGVFRDGVYVYCENHQIRTLITEDPDTTLITQCQNPKAHGSHFPIPKNGGVIGDKTRRFKDFSKEIRDYIESKRVELCEELYEIGLDLIKKEEDILLSKQDELIKKHKEVVSNWKEKAGASDS